MFLPLPRIGSMMDVEAGRLMRTALTMLGALLCVVACTQAMAYPAHYFIVHEAADGALSVTFHQLVDLSGTPESAEPQPPNVFEARLRATVSDKTSGRTVLVPRAVSSRWLRGEFAGEREIDGRAFEVRERDYVVRVPVQAGTELRLRADMGIDAKTAGTGFSLATLDIDLDAYAAATAVAPRLPPPPSVDSGTLIHNGDPSNRFDLLIVAEGYTAGQHDQFIGQATTLVNQFLAISPYKDFVQLMNVNWLFVPSNESGADKPFCNDGKPIITRDTAFDSTFCSFGIRRLVTVDSFKVLTAAAAVPDWDIVFVLVNDLEYGGSGGQVGVVTTNSNSAGIAQHEFGHTFSLLADEYATAYPGYPPCSDLPPAASPCEPNVTNQTVRSSIKWTRWIDPATPIPTVAQLADPIGAGLWQGARYLNAGMYRQCYNGIMQSLGSPFCHVDSEAFVKRMYGGGWGAPALGVSLIEPGASPAGATVTAPQFSHVAFSATVAGSLGAGALSATWLVDNNPAQTHTTVHGALQNFDYVVPDAAPHVVELRVSDSTPFLLDAKQRSRSWNVQAIAKANATTAIISHTPNPSIVGTAISVIAAVTVTPPGSGTPTGTIVVSDGAASCTVTLPATNCNVTSTTVGTKTLIAAYSGDANFNGSASPGVTHIVANGPPGPPDAPTNVVAAAGNMSATVSFAAPLDDHGFAITGYTVASNPSGGVDGNPGSTNLVRTIENLGNGTAYTFTVYATNSQGNGPLSAPSNAVTPNIGLPPLLQDAKSRKAHGGAGTFDLPLSPWQ